MPTHSTALVWTTFLCLATSMVASEKSEKLVLEKKISEASAYDEIGFTPLHWAVYNGDNLGIERLLKEGADINARDLQEGATPLHWATDRGDLPIITTLIAHGAKPTIPDYAGNTALHWATRSGNLEAVRVLEEASAPLDYQNKEGNTPLHLAAKEDFYDLVRYLSYHGANPNIPNQKGKTALHLAVNMLDPGLVTYLLENGADVHIKDRRGRTALGVALTQEGGAKRLSVIKALLAHGATAAEIGKILDETEKKNVLGTIKNLSEGLEKGKTAAREELKRFITTYGTGPSSTAFYHLARALRTRGFKPGHVLAGLTPEDSEANKEFDKGALQTFITDGTSISARFKTQRLFRELYSEQTMQLSDAKILNKIQPYAKLLLYHYKIHLMPRARKIEVKNKDLVPYQFDCADATSLIAQVVHLFMTDLTFRKNIENFKVMRLPTVTYINEQIGSFIVIYPRMLPGSALTVARLLDKAITFTKTDDNYPLHPVPRFNAKFNHTNLDSGLFYAMGDGDFKSDPRLNKLIFDDDIVLLNGTITEMAGYTDQLRLLPETKRKRTSKKIKK